MIKCTALFNYVSNVSASAQAQTRTAGWSESVYHAGEVAEATEQFVDYCELRARLLPKGSAIVGQRFQVVDGGSSTLGRRFPGNPGNSADVPQMALQLKAQAIGAVNVRRWSYRAIPDICVTEGEYLPTTAFRNAVQTAAQFITGGQWRFVARDLSNVLWDVVSISAGGLLTVAGSAGFDTGMIVQLFRCKDAADRGVSGSFKVASGPTDSTAQLINFTGNPVVEGQVRRLTYSYYGIDFNNLSQEKIVSRKVGRPFGGYSGKHSVQR